MASPSAQDVKTAMSNPSKVYKRPTDVLQDAGISRAQKIEILRQWETDARLLSVAEEENMTKGEPSPLAEVISALIALGDEKKTHEHPDTGTAPTKGGG